MNTVFFVDYFRCKKVYDGVTHAGKLYPNAYLIMILIGTLKGLYIYKINSNFRFDITFCFKNKNQCNFLNKIYLHKRKRSWFYKIVWTPDTRSVDANCHGIYATKLVSLTILTFFFRNLLNFTQFYIKFTLPSIILKVMQNNWIIIVLAILI